MFLPNPLHPAMPRLQPHKPCTMQMKHTRKHKEWKKHGDTKSKIQQQLLKAVDDMHLRQLKHPLWNYARVTPLAMINHLKDECSQIMATDFQDNRAALIIEWAPPADIELLHTNIDERMTFAAEGGDPISEINAVNAGVQVLQATGLYTIPIQE